MYIVYYSVYCDYFGVFIEQYVYTKFGCCISELLCPYHNVWPRVVYCCFTMFIELFTCIIIKVSITSPSIIALHLPVSEITKCRCLVFFTRTMHCLLQCQKI